MLGEGTSASEKLPSVPTGTVCTTAPPPVPGSLVAGAGASAPPDPSPATAPANGIVSRLTVAPATSSPVTEPLMLAGTPPRRTSRPARASFGFNETGVASSALVAPGNHSSISPAPR